MSNVSCLAANLASVTQCQVILLLQLVCPAHSFWGSMYSCRNDVLSRRHDNRVFPLIVQNWEVKNSFYMYIGHAVSHDTLYRLVNDTIRFIPSYSENWVGMLLTPHILELGAWPFYVHNLRVILLWDNVNASIQSVFVSRYMHMHAVSILYCGTRHMLWCVLHFWQL